MTTKTRRTPSATLPNVPSVTIDLDRPRRLVYTFASMQRAKEVLGTHAPDFDGPDGVLQLPGFVWACLAPGDDDISLDEVRHLLYPAMIEGIVERIGELVRASVPSGAEGNAAAPTAKAAS